MPNSEPTPNTRSSRPLISLPRFQFSLAWLLIVVTVVAVVLGLSVTLGSLLGTVFFAIVYCVLPTPLVICAIFARGDIQAFAIGAIVPWWTVASWMPNTSSFFSAIWLVVVSTTCGTVAAITRRWIRRSGA
jgi:hypothetical protein